MPITSNASSAQLIAFYNPADVHAGQVQFDLANMAAALVRLHGEEAAFTLMSEAFAALWAKWALEMGKPILRRFALEVALDNAQMSAPIPCFDVTTPAGVA